MKTARLLILLISIAATAAPCFAHHMAVVVSENNAVSNLKRLTTGKDLSHRNEEVAGWRRHRRGTASLLTG